MTHRYSAAPLNAARNAEGFRLRAFLAGTPFSLPDPHFGLKLQAPAQDLSRQENMHRLRPLDNRAGAEDENVKVEVR